MEIIFTKYVFEELGEIYFATDSFDKDVYVNSTRNSYHLNDGIRYALSKCHPGQKFVDIGANIGHYTLPLAKKGVKTLAIEALPKNFVLLTEAIAKNNLRNVLPVHAAAFSHNNVVTMDGLGAWGRIVGKNVGIATPALTIDRMLQIYDFEDAKLIKMNVEGAELSVLSGMKKCLENSTADIIFGSNALTCADNGYTTKDLKRALEDCGYSLYLIHAGMLIPRTSDDYQESIIQNFLATKNQLSSSTEFIVRNLTGQERIQILTTTLDIGLPEHQSYAALIYEQALPEVRYDENFKIKINHMLANLTEKNMYYLDILGKEFQ